VTQKLLILDIDETLIHSIEAPLPRTPDFIVGNKYYVYKRPFVDQFLAWCSKNFHLAVWTSATDDYAAEIVANIFPQGENNLLFVWSRERCTQSLDAESREHFWEKKLTKLRRRGHDLDNVIVVDDTPQMWRNSYGNLVRVNPYLGEEEDDELEKLMRYLEILKDVENVRKVEKRNWRNRL
jgi:RNA polymerase II subunit A small phosphatase-like protein